jgi:hypothetical protein
MKSLNERIRALASLQDNWDSYGARAPLAPAINATLRFASILIRCSEESLVQAIPTVDGGVALTAIDCAGEELSIEFRPDGTWKLDDCVPLAEEVNDER